MPVSKIPPNDIEAEQAVLGSMLTDKDAVSAAIEVLDKNDFYREDNKAIFEAMISLYNRPEPIDIITVKDELLSIGKFDVVGGLEYLANLPEKVPTTANVDKYIKIVEEKSILRSLIKTSNELITLGYDETQEVNWVMEEAEKRVFDLMQNRNQTGYFAMKDVLVDSFAQLERLYNQKEGITGVPSGFADLDLRTAGFHNSELIILAARPAMGKTAFALNIATNAAKSDIPVLLFSLEMSKEQLVNRVLCSEAMIDSNKLKTGKIEENDWVKIVDVLGPLSEAEMYIDDTAGISITEIRAKARKLKLEKNIGLIIIDYLQLIQGSGNRRNGSREQEISEISRSLKILAKELNIPVIALSQLSRASEQRSDHRPMLSDLRESGSIEQDADIVMFLYRDDYYNEESESKNIAEVIIAKNRSGSTGTAELLWMSNYTKFANIERYRGDEY